MSNTEATRYEVRQGAAWITLNRPDNRNALSAVLVNELADHIAAATADPAARCIVITGATGGMQEVIEWEPRKDVVFCG